MSYKVDFHIHSNFSDGEDKPVDIVRHYKDNEYDMVSITDHDTIDGVKEAEIAGEALKIKVVPGIELSTNHKEYGELHILGYYIDVDNKKLIEVCKDLKEKRYRRNLLLTKVLQEEGYKEATLENLVAFKGKESIYKPDIVKFLRSKGYNVTMPFELLNRVEREMVDTEEGICLIKEAKGIPVLAHPMRIKKFKDLDEDLKINAIDNLVKELKKKGLKGLECYHPSSDEEMSLKLVEIAEKYHLHITEGSDSHSIGDLN